MKKNSRQRAKRWNRLKKTAKRLAAYSAAAAATVVATQDRPAEAANIRHDPIPDVINGSPAGLLFNMVTGSTTVAAAISSNSTPGSIRLIGYYSPAYPYAYIYTPAFSTLGAFVGGVNLAFLGSGVIIDGNQTFGYGQTNAAYGHYGYFYNNWPDGGRGFVGIQFDLGGATHFGWAEITRSTTDNTATLHSFGYNNTPGDPAITGVPEPSALMLLAAGATGLAMWRRRRKAA